VTPRTGLGMRRAATLSLYLSGQLDGSNPFCDRSARSHLWVPNPEHPDQRVSPLLCLARKDFVYFVPWIDMLPISSHDLRSERSPL